MSKTLILMFTLEYSKRPLKLMVKQWKLLHPLLPTKYMLPSRPSENRDPQHVRVLISQLSELENYKRIG